MPATKSRAKALRKGKGRRGFTGTRRQELAGACTSTDLGPSSSTPLNMKHRKCGKDKPISNASEKKLLNSSFDEIDDQEKMKTRSTAKALGLSKAKGMEVATGYSLIDIEQFQKLLGSAVTCKACRSPDVVISLLKDTRKRHGLAELYVLRCPKCKTETSIYSSKKVENRIFEVNKRSVFACNSFRGGRQVLENFCGIMNLPPPLASASFSRHLKSVSRTVVAETDRKMSQAA